MIDPNKIVDKVTEAADDNIYSRQESESDRSDRHLADMQSDNGFAKIIRPLITCALLTVWVLAHVAALWKEVPVEILHSADAALMTAIGFYFSSRGLEKITKRKNAAAVKIEVQRQRHERKMERKRRKNA